VRRRDFIKAIAGSTAISPLALRAQQPERLRRVIALLGGARAVASPPLGRINWEEGKSCASQLR
jgi:hypothetical protein